MPRRAARASEKSPGGISLQHQLPDRLGAPKVRRHDRALEQDLVAVPVHSRVVDTSLLSSKSPIPAWIVVRTTLEAIASDEAPIAFVDLVLENRDVVRALPFEGNLQEMLRLVEESRSGRLGKSVTGWV